MGMVSSTIGAHSHKALCPVAIALPKRGNAPKHRSKVRAGGHSSPVIFLKLATPVKPSSPSAGCAAVMHWHCRASTDIRPPCSRHDMTGDWASGACSSGGLCSATCGRRKAGKQTPTGQPARQRVHRGALQHCFPTFSARRGDNIPFLFLFHVRLRKLHLPTRCPHAPDWCGRKPDVIARQTRTRTEIGTPPQAGGRASFG